MGRPKKKTVGRPRKGAEKLKGSFDTVIDKKPGKPKRQGASVGKAKPTFSMVDPLEGKFIIGHIREEDSRISLMLNVDDVNLRQNSEEHAPTPAVLFSSQKAAEKKLPQDDPEFEGFKIYPAKKFLKVHWQFDGKLHHTLKWRFEQVVSYKAAVKEALKELDQDLKEEKLHLKDRHKELMQAQKQYDSAEQAITKFKDRYNL